MAEQKGQWVTIKGVHVFIRDGESAADALNRTIAKANEDKKAKDIANRQKEIDRLNGKSAKALGLDPKKVKEESFKEYQKTLNDYSKLKQSRDAGILSKSAEDKYNELRRWIIRREKYISANLDEDGMNRLPQHALVEDVNGNRWEKKFSSSETNVPWMPIGAYHDSERRGSSVIVSPKLVRLEQREKEEQLLKAKKVMM